MPGEVHCLDELATELDAAISRLERIVAALADARPVVTGSNMAAMRRVWLAHDRLTDLVGEVGRVPAFMVDEVRALVRERLAEDDGCETDPRDDGVVPRAGPAPRRAHLALVTRTS
jgi:hypothetical protein